MKHLITLQVAVDDFETDPVKFKDNLWKSLNEQAEDEQVYWVGRTMIQAISERAYESFRKMIEEAQNV